MGWDAELVPDPQDPETFRRSHLDWSERDREPHRRILELYRRLLALRRAEPELGGTPFSGLAAESDDAARTFRLRQGRLEVLVNLGGADWDAGVGEMLLATTDRVDGDVIGPDTAVVSRMPDVRTLNIR